MHDSKYDSLTNISRCRLRLALRMCNNLNGDKLIITNVSQLTHHFLKFDLTNGNGNNFNQSSSYNLWYDIALMTTKVVNVINTMNVHSWKIV